MVQNLSKICSKCNTLKELNNFNFTSVKGKSPYLRANCKSCQSLIRKQHYRNNKQKTIEKCKIYYENHKKEKLLYSNKWKKQNIEYMKKYFRYYYKLKRKNDISFKLRENISRRIRGALFNGNKSKNTMELLGCQIKELKSHLEKQFKDGMTWDNYGVKGWHIDHIRPCASFDLTDPAKQHECFNYTNLQPLWAKDNIIKSDNMNWSIN